MAVKAYIEYTYTICKSVKRNEIKRCSPRSIWFFLTMRHRDTSGEIRDSADIVHNAIALTVHSQDTWEAKWGSRASRRRRSSFVGFICCSV